ncbi:MAG: carboxylating nicotinate-nucleotide diphosphorylase [Gemmatimonadetes bacterium]|nr:carboxylating nicotinate-nucleotide diphosphorylase [Gemmatimonadota bacterium]
MNEDPNLVRLIDLALAEDVGAGDWTTEWTVDPGAEGKAVIVAKEPLVVSGIGAASAVFRKVDRALLVTAEVDEGAAVEPEAVVLRLEGSLRAILIGERVAMNFLGHLSGIATLTREYADAVAGTGARIMDTRKTTPGWRMLEKAAVRAGGGENHRFGLHDMILVKDNHLVAAGGVRRAVEKVRDANRAGLKVEVEVTTLDQLDEVLPLGLDRILLDNMDPGTMEEAVKRIRLLGPDRPLVEASGNMSLSSVGRVAETGVDLISVGALTHSAPSADLSLRVLSSSMNLRNSKR